MENFNRYSGLKDHFLNKKKGLIITPLNEGLGDTLRLNFWMKNRMPEYLWLGLILVGLGRRNGIEIILKIFSEILAVKIDLDRPRLSDILNLSVDEQRILYEILLRNVERSLLAPLSILLNRNDFPIFNEYFYQTSLSFEGRLLIISDSIKAFSSSQSDYATDLRYLSLHLLFAKGRIKVMESNELVIEALLEYPRLDHESEKMKSYRGIIRSMEGVLNAEVDTDFCNYFWKEIGMITSCKASYISFEQSEIDYKLFATNSKRLLDFILLAHKDLLLSDNKFEVLIGSATYSLKIFNEIIENSLGNGILGRHGVRTILEIYIMLKYLLKKEPENSKIWEEYKLYGLSKYKLILLKAREKQNDENAHFNPVIAEFIVNEIMWEEYLDIDLKYFDRQGIREKSIEVKEKDLYDMLYDYDSSFAHGLWGAIRESSMLTCDTPSHQGHIIPDINNLQRLPDVKADMRLLLTKMFLIISEIYKTSDSIGSFLRAND
ncbi:DUF5677 domain-containing protein [Leptospira santarosai]|uniref:DUF5677 domain-containing protein n=1 Tax=Leptospira santarosai TaxID=28183 RepID=UPI0007749A0F|nr:DUF5677 domain-containing protein [Leptospira santarosai]